MVDDGSTGKDFEGNGSVQTWTLPQHLPGGKEKLGRNLSG
jgi:hypothetical protein